MPERIIPNGRYWADNIWAVQEWAFARIKAAGTDAEGNALVEQEIVDIADWCASWIESDPRDNGGDGYPRRQMRGEWRNVWAAYCRLGGPH
jgi:hypothetical protein